MASRLPPSVLRCTIGTSCSGKLSGHTPLVTNLHVGLLNEADPELVTVAGVGAQQLPVLPHWETVVYHNLDTVSYSRGSYRGGQWVIQVKSYIHGTVDY